MLILGCDNCGRVKGMGDGVSKTSIKYLGPYKKALQKEHESQVILQAQVDNLEKRLKVESRDLRREMDKMFVSLSSKYTNVAFYRTWKLLSDTKQLILMGSQSS